MRKITVQTTCKRMLSDVYTPVGIYLRLRDRFRDTILLEATEYHAAENSYSFIGINAIAGIEISSGKMYEYKLPGRKPQSEQMKAPQDVPGILQGFMNHFEVIQPEIRECQFAQGLFGYTAYDAVQFFETVHLRAGAAVPDIPLIRYRMYQYVIAYNHFNEELFICENHIPGIESDLATVVSLICNKDVPVYPFQLNGEEKQNMSDNDFLEMVQKGIRSCHRGDVFQIVLSRKFEQPFMGDEFNVYRALRNVNPSPYLFFLDYGDYKLFGSSPESQLVVQQGEASLNPIAGTFKRTGDDETDKQTAIALKNDSKENAEHVMLVDLARNDLSRVCDQVRVTRSRDVQFYSHVIHLVSEVKGKLMEGYNPFSLLACTFPAGTLSGAPKFRAMELIDEYEPTVRSYYGGAVGMIGFNSNVNHAIMIRTFLSRNNTLTYQAGAGVVAGSNPESELKEITNKLAALRKAMVIAGEM